MVKKNGVLICFFISMLVDKKRKRKREIVIKMEILSRKVSKKESDY